MRKHFSRNIHGAPIFPQFFSVSHTGSIVSSVIFFLARCKSCLRNTTGNFNENPSMRELANILRARASEHSSNLCEQFKQRPNFASTFKLNGTIWYPCWWETGNWKVYEMVRTFRRSVPNGKRGLPLKVLYNLWSDFPQKFLFHFIFNRNFRIILLNGKHQ